MRKWREKKINSEEIFAQRVPVFLTKQNLKSAKQKNQFEVNCELKFESND